MPKTNFIIKSYKDKLRMTYTLLMFIILILSGIFMYFQINMKVKPIIHNVGEPVVASKAYYLGEVFDDQNKILELLSNTEAFKNGEISVIKKELDTQMHKHSNLILSIKYKSLTGKEYEINPYNIKTSDYYEKKLLEIDSSTLKGLASFNEEIDEHIVFTGTKIIDNDNKLKGTLTLNIGIKKMTASLSTKKYGELNDIWIFDSFGNTILNPDGEQASIYDIEDFKKNIQSEQPGEIKTINSKDSSNNLAYCKIPNTENLYLAMHIEHGDYANAVKSLLFIVLLGAIIICYFIFLAAHKMTDLVTKPLTRMMEIIENSDGVNFIEIPNDLKSSKDEIGILANTIDKMAKNIRNNMEALNYEIKQRRKAEEHLILLNDELECRVEERTEALTKATNDLTISEYRFRIAMDASHIGIYDVDFVNNLFMVNSVFLKLINAPEYNQCVIENRDWIQFDGKLEDYVYEEDLLNIKQFSECNLPVMGEDFYTEFRLKENPNIWLSITGQSISKYQCGKVMKFIGVLQNISERKKNEAELKAAKEEAEKANLAKSQFLANMSHEIRTPMNAIVGLTHLISESDLSDYQKNYISKIQGSSKTLLRIINDILDFSKIEARRLEIENIKFNLFKIFENVATLYKTSAIDKGININFDIREDVPDVLKGDPLRLEQIISNLVTNAIKFTDRGEVNVAVKIDEEKENKVKLHFSVMDTGIGLTEEQRQRLFKAFTQADNSMTRKYGGTGLGLKISKRLVELMKGEIWVESKYGEGSTFHFTIDLDKVLNIERPSYEKHASLQGKKVLVVDDNKTSLMILERMLKSFLLEVTVLSSPFEAIELLENESFDLLIIDYNLPELSGVNLYKRLLINTEFKIPKTIFISAIAHESYYNEVTQLGVKNFLVKPINRSLMFDAITDSFRGLAARKISKEHIEKSPMNFESILKDKRILLVEDNDINQLVAKDILERVGVNVTIANNGEEAIKHVDGNKFDAVLMDVQMPIMDGYKATEILRKTYTGLELPIIAMTANALRGDREKSITSGMNDYISKPIDPETLFKTLVKWITDTSTENIEKPIKKAEVLDFNRTLVKLGNDENFYYDLLTIYCNNYRDMVDQFSSMRENQQYGDAKRFIHSLKSVTGNIGAMKLNKFIVKFEEQYASYDEESLKENLITLSALNEELINSITKVISTKNTPENQLSSTFDLCEDLNKLLEALQKARAKEIKECMNCLITNSEGNHFTEEINKIKKLVERYRFKDAKTFVQELINVVKEQG